MPDGFQFSKLMTYKPQFESEFELDFIEKNGCVGRKYPRNWPQEGLDL